MNSYDCERLRDELADCVGDSLSPAAAEHLADCDACRDLRHEARAAARDVALASADYTPMDPDGLEAKLLAALDARAIAPAPEVPPAPVSPPEAPVAKTAETPLAEAPATFPEPPRAQEPSPVVKLHDAPTRRRPARARAVFALVAAVAAAAVVVVSLRPDGGGPVSGLLASRAGGAWAGSVGEVIRAGGDDVSGLEVKRGASWEPLAARAAIPAGSALRTDPRTRARLSLADGTVLVLDRATELRLDPAAPRTASLVAGNLVADVAHTDVSARIQTPSGEVTVLGTRFALTATPERTVVRVTRGAVRLSDTIGAVEVHSGQEGAVDRGRRPTVAPAVDLAGAFVWSELGARRSELRDEPTPGLGELRARRPGSTAERDQAVRLERHSVKVRIVGGVARTEVEEVFRNESGQVLEGIYRFPLPPEAQVEDLALDVDGRMESGAFVERDRAAAIWRGAIRNATAPAQRVREEYVWVPGPWRDPALLEWQRGGRFELRVFPIPARGSRRVRIAYTQSVAASSGVRRYTYPLAHDPAGSTRVAQFDVDVQVLGNDPDRAVLTAGYPLQSTADGRRMSFSQRDFVPAGDLTVEYSTPDRGAMSAWAFDPTGSVPSGATPEDAYVALTLRPQLPRWNESHPRDYVLVVDASRSMTGERYTRASRLVGAVIAEMDRRDRFTVLACDTRCRELSGGAQPASAEGARAAMEFLGTVVPNGATDLAAQLRAAVAARGLGASDRDLRVVYLGDGVSTAGFRHPERVAASLGGALGARHATLTTVAVGADAELNALQALARVGGGAMVPYLPGEPLGRAALGVLEATWGVSLREPEVILPQGLTAIAPRVLPTLRAGEELRVTARMSGSSVRGDVVLRGTVAGAPYETRLPLQLHATQDPGNAFVPRLYAAARVADLDREEDDASKRESIALSQRFRVPSRHTSLLVLESPAMFRAFGLDRSTAAPAWSGESEAVASQSGEEDMPDAPSGAADPSMDDLAAPGDGRNESPAGGFLSARATETQGRVARRRAPVTGPARVASSSHADSIFAQPPASAASAEPPAPRQSRERAAAPIVAATPMARPLPDPRRGQWMQRVWTRRGTVRPAQGDSLADAPSSVVAAVQRAREALQANPDSRDRHRELYRWLSVAGELDEAAQVADRWIARDPLDVDALARKADALARNGQRDEATRTLEAMADARPDDVSILERLATLHERAGDERAACAWRVSLAELRGADPAHLARAVRCLRATGEGGMALRVLNALDAARRGEVERLAYATDPVERPVRGELQVSASWYGGGDLDLALIDPRGTRISWQGGRSGVTASGATSAGREAIGVSRASSGEWLVEVVRGERDPSGDSSVRGEVTVNILGERRTIPFSLQGPRARVARAAVVRESHLVPITHPPPAGSRIVW
ncbi:MAG: VIT domain-containing protein [Polyangiales bacterium]